MVWLLVVVSLGLGLSALVLLLEAGHVSAEGVEAVATLLGAVAWPAAIVTVVLLFKGQLASFIDEVAEASFPGGSVKRGDKVARELTEAAAKAGPGPPEQEVAAPADAEERKALLEAALSSLTRAQRNRPLFDLLRAQTHTDILGPVNQASGELLSVCSTILLALSPEGATQTEDLTHALLRLGAPSGTVRLVEDVLESQRRAAAGEYRFSRAAARDYVNVVEVAAEKLAGWGQSRIREQLALEQ